MPTLFLGDAGLTPSCAGTGFRLPCSRYVKKQKNTFQDIMLIIVDTCQFSGKKKKPNKTRMITVLLWFSWKWAAFLIHNPMCLDGEIVV